MPPIKPYPGGPGRPGGRDISRVPKTKTGLSAKYEKQIKQDLLDLDDVQSYFEGNIADIQGKFKDLKPFEEAFAEAFAQYKKTHGTKSMYYWKGPGGDREYGHVQHYNVGYLTPTGRANVRRPILRIDIVDMYEYRAKDNNYVATFFLEKPVKRYSKWEWAPAKRYQPAPFAPDKPWGVWEPD